MDDPEKKYQHFIYTIICWIQDLTKAPNKVS